MPRCRAVRCDESDSGGERQLVRDVSMPSVSGGALRLGQPAAGTAGLPSVSMPSVSGGALRRPHAEDADRQPTSSFYALGVGRGVATRLRFRQQAFDGNRFYALGVGRGVATSTTDGSPSPVLPFLAPG